MNCYCQFCKLDFPVTIPEHLLEAACSGEMVVFAGAGVSTESDRVLKFTLYDEVTSRLPPSPNQSFPEAMQRFTKQPDGRIKLLRMIQDRIDHIDSFPEIHDNATRFHRELGSIHQVADIITTNWDCYFESYCHATPFVNDQDIAFWSSAKRRVLKIHGSIQNLGSIVATSDDYEQCFERLHSGLIGGQLKSLLATKTIVFVGYSLRDADFVRLYDFVKAQMARLNRTAYAVSPFPDDEKRMSSDGLVVLKTDGTHFVRQLKNCLVAKGQLIPDHTFASAAELLFKVRQEHHTLHARTSMTRLPELIFAASYQDGLMHALERALNLRGSGEYTHPCALRSQVYAYLDLKKDKVWAAPGSVDTILS